MKLTRNSAIAEGPHMLSGGSLLCSLSRFHVYRTI